MRRLLIGYHERNHPSVTLPFDRQWM